MIGKLSLVTTSLVQDNDDSVLHPHCFRILERWTESIDKFEQKIWLYAEEPKPTRQRWTTWGFDRKYIQNFRYFNEQSPVAVKDEIISHLQAEYEVVLISDGGAPCFADPGQEIVWFAQEKQIPVHIYGLDCSPIQSLILSGFPSKEYIHHGFPPKKSFERKIFWQKLKELAKSIKTHVVMDTPYRLNKCLEELSMYLIHENPYVFIGFDLGQGPDRSHSEVTKSFWGKVSDLSRFNWPKKVNFVLCVYFAKE